MFIVSCDKYCACYYNTYMKKMIILTHLQMMKLWEVDIFDY